MNEPPSRKTLTKSMILSLVVHGILFATILITTAATAQKLPTPARLIVQSVALHPTKAATLPPPPEVKTEEPPPQEEPSPKEEAPKEPENQAKEPEEPPPEEPKPTPEPETKAQKVPEKAQQQKPQKARAPAKKPAPKKPTQPAKKPSQKPKESAPRYDQKMVAEALSRLNKSKDASSSSTTASKATPSKKMGSVGSLNVDQGVSSPTFSEESPYDGYQESSPEAHYIADMIRRLQLNVRLPEPGEVRVTLTLQRNGTVRIVKVVSGKTEKVKQAIAEKLRSIAFSSFGRSFSGEAEHTFRLRLSNDLLWSCG